MRNWIAKLQGNPWLVKRLVLLALLVAVGAGGFWWGRKQATGASTVITGKEDEHAVKSQGGRVVAYLFGDTPVTREEFAEYLIARFGNERLEFMVNRKIVEMACHKYNIHASEGEMALRLDMDLKAYGGATKLSIKDFENSVLKKFGKTLYEWKEDVIRPKIMMENLVRAKTKITDEDLKKGFEAKYGPKVECRMIVLVDQDKSVAQKVWEHARKGRPEFLEQARKQYIQQLASAEGKVPPIHKHLGEPRLEEAAFRLNEGEISGLLEMKDGTSVILLCEKKLPADISVKFDDVRLKLAIEVTEAMVQQRVPIEFAALQRAARPEFFSLTQTASNIMTTSYTRDSGSKIQVPPAPEPGPLPQGLEKGPTLPEGPPVVKDLAKPSEVKKK